MKMLKTTLLTITTLLCCCTDVSAHDFEVDGIYYNITSSEDLTVEVTYKGNSLNSAVYSGTVVIPESVVYNGVTYSVTIIGSYAFYGCSKLNSIDIPNTVTSIEYSAFAFCSNLISITTPNSLVSIGRDVFYQCDDLKEEDNHIQYVGTWAVSITDVKQISYELRENTTVLADGLFKNCLNMTSIELPSSIQNLGYELFMGCCNLLEISIPNSVTSIKDYAFYGCSNLNSIDIPNSVTNIGFYAFRDCI